MQTIIVVVEGTCLWLHYTASHFSVAHSLWLSTTVERTLNRLLAGFAMKSSSEMYGHDFGSPLTFPPTPSPGQKFNITEPPAQL